uniref:25S rRNA (Uridine(2843)-N(3))-methyltransferase n=1 Tax=Bionectria ochroleuca TaxID=29856 RepID=A0A8H7N556_BIOOC
MFHTRGPIPSPTLTYPIPGHDASIHDTLIEAIRQEIAAPKPRPAPSKPAASPNPRINLAFQSQQNLLDIFSSAFATVLSSGEFPNVLQEIKQALFNRDFAAAFGREDYLRAYAARWSPTRAICYASVFQGIRDHLIELEAPRGEVADSEQAEPATDRHGEQPNLPDALHWRLRAAEHAAFAQYLREAPQLSGRLTLVDSAPWSGVVALLQDQLTNPPQISTFASEVAKASNSAFVKPSQLSVDFKQQDILDLDLESLKQTIGKDPLVVTILFTLNELYTNGGLGKTTKFLGNLGQSLPNGSLLLVVDSPGSYSEATVGKEKKRYPMQWLLDHTLLSNKVSGIKWEKLESDESIWSIFTD